VTGPARPLGRRPRLEPPPPPTMDQTQPQPRRRHHARKSEHSIFIPVTPGPRPAAASGSAAPSGHEAESGPGSTFASARQLLASPQGGNGPDEYQHHYNHPAAVDSSEFSGIFFFGEDESEREAPVAVAEALRIGPPDDTFALSYPVGVLPHGALATETWLHDVRTGTGSSAQQVTSRQQPPGFPGADAQNLSVDPAFQLQYPFHSSSITSAFALANRPSGLYLGASHILISRLARLNDDMARHLSNVESLSWGVPAPETMEPCVGNLEDRQVNPIIQCLEGTSELASIINQVISPAVQDYHEGSSSSPLVATPVVLMCFSGYIQLLQIYNTIFFHMYRVLGSLHDVVGFFDSAPRFTQIGGLPPIKGDLYIKIVVQVAQHNIGAVERAMGLPTELCLSPQRTSSRSLLSYLDSPIVFESIMEQACNSSERSGRALVSSLRTNIKTVLGLLEQDC
jgi:hypothetical protein